jgi:hypothetical protein
VTQSIRIQVSNYFSAIRKMFDELEMEVMMSIKHSSGLQNFLSSAEKLTERLNDEVIDLIEDENQKMEEKVENNKFAYLVMRHKFYDKLDQGI